MERAITKQGIETLIAIEQMLLTAQEYYIENHRWPESLGELEVFCSEKPGSSPQPDWKKYEETVFSKLPDGNLQIDFTLNAKVLEESGEESIKLNGTLKTTLNIPKIEEIDSYRETMEELREMLEGMKVEIEKDIDSKNQEETP
jgi:hypothetical protein